MDKKINLLSEDFLELNRKLYFVSKETNIIYNLDLDSSKLELLGCIPEESISEIRLCSKILIWNHDMIFIPMNAKKVWKYNGKTHLWRGISLGKYENRKNKIFQAVIYEDDLFMIGCSCPAIFQLNLNTDQLTVIDKPFRHITIEKNYLNTIYFRCDFVQYETEIFMASCVDNSVMKFDLQSKEVFFYKVGNKGNQYSGIVWDGENYWLSPRYKTPLVKWDGKKDVKEYELPDKELVDEIGFLGIIATNSGLVLPGRKKCSIVISNTNKECSMKIVEKAYMFFKKQKESIFSLDTQGNLVYKNGEEKKMFQPSVEIGRLRKFQFERISNDKIYFLEKESSFFELNDYTKAISHLEDKREMQKENENIMWKILKRDI